MRKSLLTALASSAVAASLCQAVPFIPNPSFEIGALPPNPGYGSIEGWTAGKNPNGTDHLAGINAITGPNPFIDNGAIPGGSRVAFLQGNASIATLRTTIQGLTAGTTYRVNFRANSRIAFAPDGQGPFLKVLIDGIQMNVSLDYSAFIPTAFRVPPVRGGNPYHFLSFLFTANGANGEMTIEMSADGGDRSLLLDDFSIGEEGTISTSRWTNDASSGISAETTLWAYHFGSSVNTTVDNVPVPGIEQPGGANMVVTDEFTLSGPSSSTSDMNSLTGVGADSASSVMASRFFFGGTTSQVQLKNLTAGRDYVLSLLSVGWHLDSSPLQRLTEITSGGERRVLSPLEFGGDLGIRIDIPFKAAGSTHEITLRAVNPNNASFHFYGMSLNSPQSPTRVTTLNDSGPGSLREALASVAAFPSLSNITFDESLDGGTISLTSGQLEIPATTNGLTIDASNLALGLTIDAGGRSRVMFVPIGVTTTLRGLALTGGNVSDAGGAILLLNGNLELHECLIHGNSAPRGGGIHVLSRESTARLSLKSCLFSDNTSSVSGGGLNAQSINNLTLEVDDCTFSNNSAVEFGGGMALVCDDSGRLNMNIVGSTFSGNGAGNSGSGGGIFSGGFRGQASLSLVGCTFSGNTGERGAGIFNAFTISNNSSLTLSRCTLSGNTASTYGGGIYHTGSGDGNGLITLTDCQVSGNAAGEQGGGLYNDGSGGSSSMSLNHCAISGNSAGFIGGGILSGGHRFGRATLNLDSTKVFGNTAVAGGGGLACFETSETTLVDSSFYGNSTQTGGGAILALSRSGSVTLNLSACSLYRNDGGTAGGGIGCDGQTGDVAVNLKHCTLSENSGDTGGGIFAIFDSASDTLTLDACTISRNVAESEGGGVHILGFSSAPSLHLTHTILGGNISPRGPDLANQGDEITIIASGRNLISSLGGPSALTSDTPGLIVADPHLSPLGTFGGPTPTMLPLPGSAAIDAATASGDFADQRGIARPIGSANDIGATEAPQWASLTPDDYAALWPGDLDGDGVPFGIEVAIGSSTATPPGGAAPVPLAKPRSSPGGIVLTFGNNPLPPAGTTLRLMRSTTMEEGSFTEIARIENGITLTKTNAGSSFSLAEGNSLATFIDPTPADPRAFYFLKSDYTPPQWE